KQKASTLLHVPSDMKLALVLGLGVAKEERTLSPLPPDGSTVYWRDAKGVHHVPKRSLDDVIIARY
ncbi:MAG: nitroreductase, partial [Desulfovibrio sp.]|nr:nitroreductase [Desulfovibrio sp.]